MVQLNARDFVSKTGETVVVRSATLEDAAAIVAHARAVVDEDAFNVTTTAEFDLTEEQERDWIRKHCDEPGWIALVAEAAGEVVGLIHSEARSRKRIAHVGVLGISVKREWRGCGIGTALLQALIDWAEAEPTIEKLALAVFATNARAIGLYRKLGFVEEGRRPREVKLGANKYVDDVLMYRFV